jgi:hypothetical protein
MGSLSYIGPSGTDGCPYIQFSFLTAKNQSAGWVKPGQADSACVAFANATVTGYDVNECPRKPFGSS